MNHPQINQWVSSSETQESASPLTRREFTPEGADDRRSSERSGHPPLNGGVHPMDTKVSEETVNVHGHEFRRGFLRI